MRDWVDMYLKALTDEELAHSIIEGRNSGVFVLGHLVASDDTLTEYLGAGPMLYPELQRFAQSSIIIPVSECPPASELRTMWKAVCDKNDLALAHMRDDDLDQPHAMIEGNVEDDYFKTKERVITNWIFHQLHHAGQLALLLGKHGRRLI